MGTASLIDIPINLSDPDSSIPVRANYTEDLPALSELFGWYTAGADYVTKDGSNNVSAMIDRSTNGENMVAVTGNPLWVDEVMNGRPILRFAADAVMRWGTASVASFPTTESWTKVVIMRPDGVTATSNQNILSDSRSSKHTLFRVNGTGDIRNDNSSSNSATASAAAAGDEDRLIVASWDADTKTSKIAIDGGAVSSDTNASAAPTANYLFLGGPSTTAQLRADVADVMLFNVDILAAGNASIYNLVKAYAESKYGIGA